MNNEEVKKEWENKLRTTFQDSKALIDFMIHTMENFGYRYLNNPNLEMSEKTFILLSFEENMGNALKSSFPQIKEGVKQLAKSVPREEKPSVASRVKIDIHELSADKGKMTLSAQVSWAHPRHLWSGEHFIEKKKIFSWDDLQIFRKGFPLAMQEVSDLFL
ncbi:MAG: hypothetical protein K2P81_13640 [Bacteriovoracaceae bacterium]|nr:hypothetical protein [Bacteriovoracaceae bacterium]